MAAAQLTVKVARPEDAAAFIALRLSESDAPAEDLATLVARFIEAPPDRAANRFIGYVGEQPVGCFSLPYNASRVSIIGFVVYPQYRASYAPALLQRAIALAKERGSVLEAHYNQQYRPFYLQAGFQDERERLGLQASIADYQATPLRIPNGIHLRPPQPDEAEAVGELQQLSYAGTEDAAMLGATREAAIEVIRTMFDGQYGPFDFAHSRLAEDEQGRLVGGCLVSSGRGDVLFILSLAVLPAWQGKGLGRALLAESFNQAAAAGIPQVGLAVSLGNDKALALYRSFGMTEIYRFYEAELTL